MRNYFRLWAVLVLSMQTIIVHTQNDKILEPAVLIDTPVDRASLIAKVLEESSIFLQTNKHKIGTLQKNKLSKEAKQIIDKFHITLDALILQVEKNLANFNELITNFKQEDRTILSQLLHSSSNLSQQKRTEMRTQTLILIECFETLRGSLIAQHEAMQSIISFLHKLLSSHRHTLKKHDAKLFILNKQVKRLKMYKRILQQKIAWCKNTISRLNNFNSSLGITELKKTMR